MSLVSKWDRKLAGQPNQVLTALLIGLAILAIVVALFAPWPVKASVAIWMILP